MALLEIKDLSIQYITKENTVSAVNRVNLNIEKGETLGLVGETGAGKTTMAYGIMGLVPDPPGKVTEGQIIYKGENILEYSKEKMRALRGKEISMIFQDPMSALNPIMKVGDQIAEVIRLHEKCSHAAALKKSLEMLDMVGIPSERSVDYPHSFSGGMKQRVIIAIALACMPSLLIADEPTTALDVTIQAQVLEMMNDLKTRLDTSTILITHDLGVVAEICNKVAIMYAGEIVEYGTLEHIFHNATHPYTKGLFGALPSLDTDVHRLNPIPGLMPDPARLPEGCYFSERCPANVRNCKDKHPQMTEIESGHFVRCLHCVGGEHGE